MASRVEITASPGVRLTDSGQSGVSLVQVLDVEARFGLPWDRFARLKAVSDHLRKTVGGGNPLKVLDAGGFDGALALFLPGHQVSVVDPATTGGCASKIPLEDGHYDVVVSIDALEHVRFEERSAIIAELVRLTGQLILINLPNPATLEAQKVVLSLTGNRFVREHVEMGLPEERWMVSELQRQGLSCQVIPNTSLAQWASQMTLQNLAPEAGAAIGRYLIEAHQDEPFSVPLYYLYAGTRNPRGV